MRSVRPTVNLVLLLAVEVAAVVGLHRLGGVEALALPSSDWSLWLATSAPADVVMAVLRLVALGSAWWVLGSTVLYAAALASRVPRAVAAVEWATLPVLRRTADRAVAVLLAAATTVGSGGVAVAGQAQVSPGRVGAQIAEVPFFPPSFESPEAAALPVLPPVVAPAAGESVEVPVLPPALAPPGALPPAPSAGTSPDDEDGGGAEVSADPGRVDDESSDGNVHRVVSGEHLWSIAAETVAHARGMSPADVPSHDVHRYWLALIATNEGMLRSGDPDLVFPGEDLLLPPVTET